MLVMLIAKPPQNPNKAHRKGLFTSQKLEFRIDMYKLYINGTFRGHYKTAGEAMGGVDKWARPFRASWKILDGFKKIYAQG